MSGIKKLDALRTTKAATVDTRGVVYAIKREERKNWMNQLTELEDLKQNLHLSNNRMADNEIPELEEQF